jgi:hypothetical protein
MCGSSDHIYKIKTKQSSYEQELNPEIKIVKLSRFLEEVRDQKKGMETDL